MRRFVFQTLEKYIIRWEEKCHDLQSKTAHQSYLQLYSFTIKNNRLPESNNDALLSKCKNLKQKGTIISKPRLSCITAKGKTILD